MGRFFRKKSDDSRPSIAVRYKKLTLPSLEMKYEIDEEQLNYQLSQGLARDYFVNLIIANAQSVVKKSALFENRAQGAVNTIELIMSEEFDDEFRYLLTKGALFGIYAGISENVSKDFRASQINLNYWNALIIYSEQLKEKNPISLSIAANTEIVDLAIFVGYAMGRNGDLHIGRVTSHL